MTTKLEQETSQELQIPKMYSIAIHNDDYTPEDFVSAVLSRVFNLQTERAHALTKEIHVTGKAVLGEFTKDVAETKVAIILDAAKSQSFPLLVEVVEK